MVTVKTGSNEIEYVTMATVAVAGLIYMVAAAGAVCVAVRRKIEK